MSNCNCHTTINRDGSGQLGRYLKALDPANAPIDDRSINDLLVFAKRYAGQIRFYDIPESQASDEAKAKINWREFFRRDMAVTAASLAVLDISGMRSEYEDLRQRLDEDPDSDKLAGAFGLSVAIASRIDRWLTVALPGLPLRTDLELGINAYLGQALQHIVAFEAGYKFIDSKHPLNIDYSRIENDEVWGIDKTIDPDASIYHGTTLEDKIRSAALYADDVFNSFYSFTEGLIQQSDKYVTFAMEEYPAHQPHMALFISFLTLFNLAQQQLNGLTQKMLDFYYKEVLQLTPADAVPDKVHVVFELAKDVSEYQVAKGTGLDAGKDAGGIAQTYTTQTDIVVNQAKVKELKTIYVQKENTKITGIYARPVANSADGNGAAFDTAATKWPTLGKGAPKKDSIKNICDLVDETKERSLGQSAAQTGFAIASPHFLLQGGNRLTLIGIKDFDKLVTPTAINALNEEPPFEIWLTGEKGWVKINNFLTADEAKDTLIAVSGNFSPDLPQESAIAFLADYIALYLPPGEQAIIGYNATIHQGEQYATTQPVMKLLLNPKLNIAATAYNNIEAKNILILSKVGSLGESKGGNPIIGNFDGLKKLVIQTEDGLVEAGKPFNPFTAFPGQGKSFYIGSEEIFNKVVTALTINIQPTQTQSNNPSLQKDPPFRLNVLDNRQWINLVSEQGRDFTLAELAKNVLHVEKLSGETARTERYTIRRVPIAPVTKWSNDLSKGFFQIENRIPVFVRDNTTYMQASQDMAPSLEIKEISISYVAMLFGLVNGIDQLFHVYPFGVVETFVENNLAELLETSETTSSPGKKAMRSNVEPFEKMMQQMQAFIMAGAAAEASTGARTAVGPVVVNPVNDAIKKLEEIFGKSLDFGTMVQLRKGLLLKAKDLLLPQYTFLNAYDRYTKIFEKPAPEKGKESSLLYELVLSTSGIREKISGGNNQYSGAIQEEGMLLIGLEKAKPLQSISLLLQFAEGSAADEDNEAPPIRWSYLTNNEWRPMQGEDVVSDGTYGFQATGIIKLNIPADATSNNTIVASGLHWFCASVQKDSHRIPQLINIVTQAVEAQFANAGNDTRHYDAALPAGSISKLAVAATQVTKVVQPFASWDGKHKEVGKELYIRVSERLRHKNRAINTWDYEQIILNRFPTVYKIKAITHTDPECLCRDKRTSGIAAIKKNYVVAIANRAIDEATLAPVIADMKANPSAKAVITPVARAATENPTATDLAKMGFELMGKAGISDTNIAIVAPIIGLALQLNIAVTIPGTAGTNVCCGPQINPGHVLLIPIPNFKNRNGVDLLRPKTSRRVLIDIENHLKKIISPFVKVHAKNPVYEQIITGFRVQFVAGADQGYYLKKLNEEIVAYLTPWAFDAQADVQFGQKIYASSIINFIEERPYVDFITDFVMGVCKDECCAEKPTLMAVAAGQYIKTGADKERAKVVGSMTSGFSKEKQTPVTDVTAKETQPQELSEKDVLAITPQTGKSIKQAAPVVVEPPGGQGQRNTEIGEKLARICGCTQLEQMLEKDMSRRSGDIVATPSTQRSILVSAPQHIIIPYEAPAKLSPCEQRQVRVNPPVVEAEPAPVAPPPAPAPAPVKDRVVVQDEAADKTPTTPVADEALEKAKETNKLTGINQAKGSGIEKATGDELKKSTTQKMPSIKKGITKKDKKG